MQIKKELQKNKQVMQEAFRDCGDIIMREFRIRGGEGTLFLAYTDNIVNGDAIQNFIMTNVMARCEMQGTEGLLQSLMEEVIAIGELTKITTMEEVFPRSRPRAMRSAITETGALSSGMRMASAPPPMPTSRAI